MNKTGQFLESMRVSMDAYTILIPICISILSYYFIYRGFATSDSVRYAIDLDLLSVKGLAWFRNCFNVEQSFGYYLALLAITKIFPNMHNVSALINTISWIASTIMIAFLFAFSRSLYNTRVALYTSILVLIAPSIWFLSHYGHPAL